MIELIDNSLQITVLTVCAALSVYLAVRHGSRTWTLLSFFYGSWLLGDVYWLSCLIFYDRTPQISLVSDLSWYAAFIFLYMILRQVSPPEKLKRPGPAVWIGPLFAAAMAVYFMQWGQILNNIIYAGIMGLLLYSVTCRISAEGTEREKLLLPYAILIICMLEYALWTASCIWSGETLMNPYYWCDFLITLSFPFLLAASGKARKA